MREFAQTDEEPVFGIVPHPELRVSPLTAAEADRFDSEAIAALNGDGTCSLSNMMRSCFASERCANGGGQMRLREFVHAPIAAVVHRGDVFVGCVSTTFPVPWVTQQFPRTEFPRDAYILTNLCVDLRQRRQGAGRLLIDHVRERVPDALYLMIAKGSRTTPELAETFASRVERLLRTYASMGFNVVDESSSAFLLRRA